MAVVVDFVVACYFVRSPVTLTAVDIGEPLPVGGALNLCRVDTTAEPEATLTRVGDYCSNFDCTCVSKGVRHRRYSWTRPDLK